jgi:hypothetical protein
MKFLIVSYLSLRTLIWFWMLHYSGDQIVIIIPVFMLLNSLGGIMLINANWSSHMLLIQLVICSASHLSF